MLTFLLFVLLFIVSWPLALLALLLYPVVWLLTLPFRLLGIAVEGIFDLLRLLLKIAFWPFRWLAGESSPRTA